MIRIVLALATAATLGGCDVLGESPARPWRGYSRHKEKQQSEWWFTSYATHRDCIEDMTYQVNHSINAAWYSLPVGCGYTSNSYIKAWMAVQFYGGDFRCIARYTSAEAESGKHGYGPPSEKPVFPG